MGDIEQIVGHVRDTSLELHQAITQIDGSTQNNASTVEELANTLDNLRSIATVLAEDVQKFKTSQS
jgi:methyl-accepting chemotaxis protein